MFTSSISAINTASWQVAAAAGNIANATTPGYQSQRVDQATAAGGGVEIAGVTSTGAPDFAGDAVTLIEASAAFKVNLRVLKAQNETLGALLDLIA
ncbi:MAG: flagellar basal body protein [Planctomycetes bacterium]|nr:flagellar basal body protein [Planctomycetota bacterium]